MGEGVSLTLLLALENLFLVLGYLVWSQYEGFCLVLLDLVFFFFFPVWLFSRGGLLFSEEETKREWIWGTDKLWKAGRGRRKRNCGQNVMNKKGLFFQLKINLKRKPQLTKKQVWRIVFLLNPRFIICKHSILVMWYRLLEYRQKRKKCDWEEWQKFVHIGDPWNLWEQSSVVIILDNINSYVCFYTYFLTVLM